MTDDTALQYQKQYHDSIMVHVSEASEMFSQFSNPVSLVIIAFVAASFVSAFLRQRLIKKNGIETTAAVTAVTEESFSSGDGIQHYDDYHVSYIDRNGRLQEGTLANPAVSLQEGQRIVIRYSEDNPEEPVFIREL